MKGGTGLIVNNFLLIDATDRSKRFFIAFFTNTPFKKAVQATYSRSDTKISLCIRPTKLVHTTYQALKLFIRPNKVVHPTY